MAGIDLEHCKGCGVCAEVCPPKCIAMHPEGEFAEEAAR
jgi:pyruvate ferredoxin oxidoreductase delta subunit